MQTLQTMASLSLEHTSGIQWLPALSQVLVLYWIHTLLLHGDSPWVESKSLTTEIYANPANYGIIESRTHKWDPMITGTILSLYLPIDLKSFFYTWQFPVQVGWCWLLSALRGSIYYCGRMSTVKLKATGILQTNLSFERCHYSTRLCPALYYTYYYSHHNLSKSLS